MRGAIDRGIRRLVGYASRGYVAGPGLDDALRRREECHCLGVLATIGYWNHTEEDPETVAAICNRAIRAIASEWPETWLSIKAPALGFRDDLVMAIAWQARERGVGLHFDSLQPEVAERTWALIGKVAQVADKVGCTLPAQWERSREDTRQAIDLGLRVRVVKGQWADPSSPCDDTGAAFLGLIDLLAGRARHVAVATHDHQLARESLARLRAQGSSCELELLYGLPRRSVLEVALMAGVGARLYIPCGESWLPYAVSQLLRHPGRIGWMLSEGLVR